MTISQKDQIDETVFEILHYNDSPEKPNLNGDWLNFWLLIVLYIIQGFPIGLSGSIPNLLQTKYSANYNDQVSF